MITLLEFLQKKHIDIDPEAVDLDLPSGTLWCSHNVGAEKPEDYGDYFAWGETKLKKEYNWETYKWDNPCSKYNRDNKKTLLDPEDDAAHVNMGEDWHIPTKELMQELKDKTKSKWITLNGVNGRLFTGSNGNSIFIPAAGYCNGSSPEGIGYYCCLWSSTLDSKHYWNAYYMSLYSDNVYPNDYYEQCYGHSVRGITNK